MMHEIYQQADDCRLKMPDLSSGNFDPWFFNP
jgi:hypothetical protein